MEWKTAGDLYELLRSERGRALTSDEIERLITLEEGIQLDFKDGALLQDKGRRNREIRGHVASFANAAGGLLVLGVSDAKPRAVTGVPKVGGKSAAD